MTLRFLDLHVHSNQSTGEDSREDMEQLSRSLKTQIRFCDGVFPGDGVEIASSSGAELKRRPVKATYVILKPLSKEAAQASTRVKNAIIQTGLTPTLARAMHDHGCSAEICLSGFFGSSGIRRIRAIKRVKTNLKYARKYDVPMVVTTASKSVYGLRSPHQTYELLRVLGFADEEANEAMYDTPKRIVQNGEDRVERRLISEHVRVI